MTLERRFISADIKAEFRQGTGSEGDEMALAGYAAVFNSPSEDLGGFREMIMPGAFARAIREKMDVRALVNHDPSLILGRVKNSSLQLDEDARGLKFRVVLPPTQTGRDTYELVKRGDMDACSFAFMAREQSWEDTKDEQGNALAIRKLMDVDLMDVSVVLNPAYSATSVSARSLFPEGEPVEVHSAIEKAKKAAEARGSEAQPPEPYAISLPQPFDSDMKQEWWNAFMEEYKDAVKRRKLRGQEAIAAAIAHANTVVQPKTEADPQVSGQAPNPTPLKGKQADTDMGGDDAKKVSPAPNPNRSAEDEAIESRIYKSVDEIPDYIPKAKAKQWMEVWNSAYKAAKKDGKSDKDAETLAFKEANGVIKKRKSSAEGKTEAEGTNGVSETMEDEENGKRCDAEEVSDPSSPNYNPEDPMYDPELDPSSSEYGGTEGASRSGKKTKRVGDEDLTADKFAYVGDPEKVATWKLPIHDAAHVRNALARFGQTKGIPSDKKESVWKKIVAAAKKFGIHVSEEDSARAAISHDVTVAAFNEEAFDSVAESLRMRKRIIEIDLTL